MKEELITKAYEIAKERYAAIGVDVNKALDTLQKFRYPYTAGRQMMLPDLNQMAHSVEEFKLRETIREKHVTSTKCARMY